MSDFWVFGYGSLMWRPDFPHAQAAPALISGVHRSLCIYSWVHRGTRQRPGLVLGLDRGGSCRGVAFAVAGRDRAAVLAYLRKRELVTAVYHETWRPIRLVEEDDRVVRALTYVADRSHPQYAGRLTPEGLIAHVRHARGGAGDNATYVISTAAHLRRLGIRDETLERLAAALASGGKR